MDRMSKKDNFEAWQIVWTPKFIQRFWDWVGTNPTHEENYFSNRVGEAILDEVNKHIKISGLAVDIGAGPGYLVEKIIKRGIDCIAVDTSPKSLEKVNKRLQGHPHFVGARLSLSNKIPIADGTAEVVFIIEAVEHMSDDVITSVLLETKRITRPGGYLVITTPNDEDLSELETICPNCGCVFHTIQHIRSFTVGQLRQLMNSAGYTPIACYPLVLSKYGKLLRPLQALKYIITKRKWPRLIYIGKKRMDDNQIIFHQEET